MRPPPPPLDRRQVALKISEKPDEKHREWGWQALLLENLISEKILYKQHILCIIKHKG